MGHIIGSLTWRGKNTRKRPASARGAAYKRGHGRYLSEPARNMAATIAVSQDPDLSVTNSRLTSRVTPPPHGAILTTPLRAGSLRSDFSLSRSFEGSTTNSLDARTAQLAGGSQSRLLPIVSETTRARTSPAGGSARGEGDQPGSLGVRVPFRKLAILQQKR